MPKDNEVDEKVIARYVWTNAGMKGGEPQWAGNWVRYDDHSATVAELRAEVERLRKSNELYSFAMNTAGIDELKRRADAAERRVGELEALLAAIRPYAQHDDACGDMDAYNNATIESCGCGLDSLLDAASEALTGADPT